MTYAEVVDQAINHAGGQYLREVILASPSVAAAARKAGVNRTHLYRLMHRHGIEANPARRRHVAGIVICR